MNTATAVRDKDLTVVIRTLVTTNWNIGNEVRTVAHSCGRSVAGSFRIVAEAHRQHLLHCSG